LRYRTAAILSAVIIAVTVGMFALPAAVWAAFLPGLKQGLDPIPGYQRILLDVAIFCVTWKWILALLSLPSVAVLFIVAASTAESRVRSRTTPPPPTTSKPPALWNPSAAAGWSLLFSTAFGAFLHARNADAMGRPDEAKANRAWFYVTIAYCGLSLLPIPLPRVLFELAPIGLLLGWYFTLAAKQIRYVKETWQDRYVRKPWTKPLIIAFCCLIGTFIVFAAANN
jgi:hypothetical protein